jgi:hypothetical protein
MLLMYNSLLSSLSLVALLLGSSTGTLASGFSPPFGRQHQQQRPQHSLFSAPQTRHGHILHHKSAIVKTSSASTTRWTQLSVPRGGGGGGGSHALKATSSSSSNSKKPFNTGTECPVTGAATVLSSLWGTFGVVYILAKAIKRVLPIAMEPFQASSGSVALSQFELGCVPLNSFERDETNCARQEIRDLL